MSLQFVAGVLVGLGVAMLSRRLLAGRRRYYGTDSAAIYRAHDEAATDSREYGQRRRTAGEKDSDGGASARARYAGYTKPNIPHVSESESTITRHGHHVLIGRTARPLKPDFISAHKAKKAMERQRQQEEKRD